MVTKSGGWQIIHTNGQSMFVTEEILYSITAGYRQVAAGSNLLFAGRIDGVDNILIEKF